MTAQLHFVTGEATCPVGAGNKIIAHVCNDADQWGKGFALAISKRWRQPRDEYMLQHSRRALMLGRVQLVRVEKSIWVANLIAQDGTGKAPFRPDALLECLKQVGFEAHQRRASLHLPRTTSQWDECERLIRETLPGSDIYVYDPPR